jgi:hypothetical protein
MEVHQQIHHQQGEEVHLQIHLQSWEEVHQQIQVHQQISLQSCFWLLRLTQVLIRQILSSRFKLALIRQILSSITQLLRILMVIKQIKVVKYIRLSIKLQHLELKMIQLLDEQSIFQLLNIQLFLRIYQLGRTLWISLSILMGRILFSIQLHSNLWLFFLLVQLRLLLILHTPYRLFDMVHIQL